MTICNKCGSEFDLSVTSAERHDYSCSLCKNAYNRAWRAAHPDRVVTKVPQDYRREYYHKVTKANTVAVQKRSVRDQLNCAVKSGKVNRQPCEVCGSSEVHGHHDDYSKPLDVRWLCPPHHRAVHKQDLK